MERVLLISYELLTIGFIEREKKKEKKKNMRNLEQNHSLRDIVYIIDYIEPLHTQPYPLWYCDSFIVSHIMNTQHFG